MKVPAFMLKKLYVPKSLANGPEGATIRLKNTMASATLVKAPTVSVDGKPLPEKDVVFKVDGRTLTAAEITPTSPIEFKKGVEVECIARGHTLPPGKHTLKIAAESREWQTLEFDVEDTL